MCQYTRPLSCYSLINMPNNYSPVKSMVRLEIAIAFIFYGFYFFFTFVVAKLITVSLPLGKSGSLVFLTLAANPYTSAYSVNRIHQTCNYLCSPMIVGRQTGFVDISIFIFLYYCPSLGLYCPTSKYVEVPLYLLRLTTRQLSSARID